MKKLSLLLVGIATLALVGCGVFNSTTNEEVVNTIPTTDKQIVQLGIIPVLEDENALADWKGWAVLDEYTNVVANFEAENPDTNTQIELVFATQGCILESQLKEVIAGMAGQNNVQTYISIPCPVDEVALDQGKQQIRRTLEQGVEVVEEVVNTDSRENQWEIDSGGLFVPYTWEVAERTQEAIEQQINSWNYCEVDADCATFYASCPFGCAKAVNVQFVEPAQALIEDWRTKQAQLGNPQCVYGCVETKGVKCESQKCVVQFAE